MRTTLEIAAVSKNFGARQVLRQVWLQVRSAEVVGLIGANGAGKSTLIRIAAGLVLPDSGCVRWAQPAAVVRYFGGEMTLPPGVRASRWSRLFGVMTDERRRIGDLSRGTRQAFGLRVVLAGAAAGVLLLDEPWEGLDPAATNWLIDGIRRWRAAGAGVLLSSHRLRELEAVCSRIVMLQGGRCQPVRRPDERRAAAL